MSVTIPCHSLLPGALGHRLRSATLAAAAPLLGPLLYRLCLGLWPTQDEARLFAAGLRDRATPLPPCYRAMLNVPAARTQLSRLLLLDMARRAGLPTNEVPAQRGDPLRFWQGPPIAFLHLEKTAGISLAALLTPLFHPAQIDPDPHRSAAPHMVAPFAGRAAAEIRRRALIYGHYDLPALQQLDPGRFIITFFRQPAARILSLYYFWRSMDLALVRDDVSSEAVALAHRYDLLDFLQSDHPALRDHIDNVYVRRLTGLYATGARFDRVAVMPSQTLSQALQALQHIDFVGVTEDMDHSIAALAAALDFTPPAFTPRENDAQTNAGPAFRPVPRETLTEAHRRQLARLTRLDDMVYRAACARLSQHDGHRAPGARHLAPVRVAALR